MISALRRAEILQKARETAADHNFTELPVDPKKIAGQCDITLMPWKPEALGISGFLMNVENNFGIGYSTAIGNEGFENFTVAHELGHYFLDGHVEALFSNGEQRHYSKSGFVSNDVHEKEADLFASELLMPEQLFKQAMSKAGIGFAAIEKLASLGKTSLVATAIRYVKATDDPLAVILSEGHKINWCFVSKSFSECPGIYVLPKGFILPQTSTTYEFNKNLSNIELGNRQEDYCRLRAWFERARDIEVQEDVVGLGHYGKTLTVLYTEEEVEDEDADIEEEQYESEGRGRGTWRGSWWRGDS